MIKRFLFFRSKDRPCYPLFCFFWVLGAAYFYPTQAYAYLDPGTGNALIYLLVSLLGAAFYLCKEVFYKAGSLLGHTSPSNSNTPPSPIVIFSEGKNYWLTFKPIIEAFIDAGKSFTYLTMDVEDPALTIDHPLMQSRYVGKGSAGFARICRYHGKVMLSTTPNIGNPGYPMPKPPHIECLAHVCHGVGDIALYHKGSLDCYDTVLMVGDFMLPSIRKTETIRGISAKECVSLGLPYLDELALHIEPKKHQSSPPVILVAPSWGEKSSLTLYGASFVKQLAQHGYQVILRPHPHSFIAENDLITGIIKELQEFPNVTVDTAVDSSVSMSLADVMVSDKSCIRFDFAFLYERPVISLDIPLRHPELYEVADLGSVWEDTVAHRLGPVLPPESFGDIVPAVEEALSMAPASLAAFRNECVAFPGKSGKAIADWAIARCISKE